MIWLKNIHIKYGSLLLDKEEIKIPASKITLIRGESGSGKSALLYRIGMISDDFEYEYYWDNQKIDISNNSITSEYRKNDISFVLQENDLLEHLNVEETIMHHALLSQHNFCEINLNELLNRVHLDVQLDQNIMTLSLGERQRLAIACSLIKNPKLLILDEPTASLDNENENLIFEILKQLSLSGMTIVIASHSELIEKYADVKYNIINHKLLANETIHNIKECGENSAKKVTFEFYKKYAKNYLSYYQFMYMLMIMVVTLSLTICNILTIIINNNLKSSQEVLISQFDNKLIVTKDANSHYINEQYKSFINSNDKLDSTNLYPLIKLTAKINDDEVYIIPYYETDEFGKNLESKFPIDNGVYLDQQTYYNLNLKDSSQKTNIEIEIVEFKNKNEIKHNITTDIEISGVLKKGVNTSFIKGNTHFIYMNHKNIDEIYNEYCTSQEFLGYLSIHNSFNDLKKAKESFVSNGYNVNDSFIDIELIDNLIHYYNQLQFIIITIIFTISSLINIILSYNLYYQRKKEVSILKISGLKKHEINNIFLLETFIEIAIVLLLVTVSNSILLLTLNQLSIDSLKIMFFIETIYSLIWIFIQYLEINYLTSHIKMERELRNDSIK